MTRATFFVLAVVVAVVGPMQGSGAQELRAVIAGVNDYQFERKLLGAVNDANSVADAVRPIAKGLEVLRDGQATKSGLMEAWNREMAASRAGDTLLVMFSGHGGSEWVGITPATPRGFREFWVMPDFNRTTPEGLEQRIAGPEIEAMVRRANDKGVRTLLLADHCYSGAVYRQAGVDIPRIRQIPTMIARGAPPIIARPQGSETELSPLLPGLTSLGASRADTPVAEVKITESGKIHGALSFAFARALTDDRRAVDPDGSGAVRLGLLLDYLQNAIVEISGGDPQLRSADPRDEILFRLSSGRALTPVAATPAKPVPMYVMGLPPAEGRAVVAGIADAAWADDANNARVIWQWESGKPRLIDGTNRIISFDARRNSLAGAVGKIRDEDALALRGAAGKMVIQVTNLSGVSRPVHVGGQQVKILVRELPGPHLVVFNLTWDGQVELLYPQNDAPIAWPTRAVPIGGTTTVGEPFGEDRLVALASPNALPGVVEALSEMHEDGKRGRARSHDATALVERVLASDAKAEVATTGLFTVSEADRCLPDVIRDAVMQAACPR